MRVFIFSVWTKLWRFYNSDSHATERLLQQRFKMPDSSYLVASWQRVDNKLLKFYENLSPFVLLGYLWLPADCFDCLWSRLSGILKMYCHGKGVIYPETKLNLFIFAAFTFLSFSCSLIFLQQCLCQIYYYKSYKSFKWWLVLFLNTGVPTISLAITILLSCVVFSRCPWLSSLVCRQKGQFCVLQGNVWEAIARYGFSLSSLSWSGHIC